MNPMKNLARCGVAAALVCSAMAAAAQTTSTISGTILPTSPLTPHVPSGATTGYHFDSNTACQPHFEYAATRYVLPGTLTVSATGSYSLEDVGTIDATIALFSASPNPSSPATNCIASVDDGPRSFNLTAGTTYYVMVTSYGDDPDNGNFSYRVIGPGTATLRAIAPAVTAVPTLGEWSLLLATLMLGGAAARRLGRRGQE